MEKQEIFINLNIIPVIIDLDMGEMIINNINWHCQN
jgi:hypothetical protein